MHATAMDFIRSAVERTTIPVGAVLEIGGRNINGTVRPLFDGIARSYTSIDLYAGPGVDVVADVCTLIDVHALSGHPIVACVVCCEVLEHALDPEGICRWAFCNLVPGGVFLVTAASPSRLEHSGIDGGNLRPGEHYAGVSREDLAAWLTRFTVVEISNEPETDVYAIARKGQT